MTTTEFSNEFDILLNSYSTNGAFGVNNSNQEITLDEYEKSVFLTKAQEEIVQSLYTGSGVGSSFEDSEKLRRELESLVKATTLTKIDKPNPTGAFDDKSTFYSFLEEEYNSVWFIIYEHAIINNTKVKVTPIRHNEWSIVKDNPFKKPNKKRVVRIDSGSNIIELISENPISEYHVKYLSKPSPIILINLPKDLTINGDSEVTECKLNTALHRPILDRAVQLAATRIKAQANNNNV